MQAMPAINPESWQSAFLWPHVLKKETQSIQKCVSACALSNKRQFLAQVTEPQVFVNAS
jgi:hypothetical protein